MRQNRAKFVPVIAVYTSLLLTASTHAGELSQLLLTVEDS
jgi:hypothetical protein